MDAIHHLSYRWQSRTQVNTEEEGEEEEEAAKAAPHQ